jgi:hypothetical protein
MLPLRDHCTELSAGITSIEPATGGLFNDEKTSGWSKDFFRPGERSKRDRNPIAYLDAGDFLPDRLHNSRTFTPMTEGSFGFRK